MTDLKMLLDNQTFVRLSDGNYVSCDGKLHVVEDDEYLMVLDEDADVVGIVEHSLHEKSVLSPEDLAICRGKVDFRSIRIEEKNFVLDTKDITFIYHDCPPAAYLEIQVGKRVYTCIVPTSFRTNVIKALLWKP